MEECRALVKNVKDDDLVDALMAQKIIKAIRYFPRNILQLPEHRVEEQYIRAAITAGADIDVLKIFAQRLNQNRDLALSVVTRSGRFLKYLPAFQDDEEVVLAAVKNHRDALKFAAPAFKSNHRIVSEAVTNDGGALEYASDDFRDNRGLVLKAVRQDGSALRYASDDLRNDREVVLNAV